MAQKPGSYLPPTPASALAAKGELIIKLGLVTDWRGSSWVTFTMTFHSVGAGSVPYVGLGRFKD